MKTLAVLLMVVGCTTDVPQRATDHLTELGHAAVSCVPWSGMRAMCITGTGYRFLCKSAKYALVCEPFVR